MSCGFGYLKKSNHSNMELTLYKAHRADGKGWVEGMPTFDFKHIFANDQTNSPDDYEIKPETLSIYTGLDAEWFNEGIDPRIWSGDLFDAETILGNFKKWQVVYKQAAFWAERMDNGETHLLSDFLSNYSYTKIGSIHDQK